MSKFAPETIKNTKIFWWGMPTDPPRRRMLTHACCSIILGSFPHKPKILDETLTRYRKVHNVNSHTSMLDGFYLTTQYQGECGHIEGHAYSRRAVGVTTSRGINTTLSIFWQYLIYILCIPKIGSAKNICRNWTIQTKFKVGETYTII